MVKASTQAQPLCQSWNLALVEENGGSRARWPQHAGHRCAVARIHRSPVGQHSMVGLMGERCRPSLTSPRLHCAACQWITYLAASTLVTHAVRVASRDLWPAFLRISGRSWMLNVVCRNSLELAMSAILAGLREPLSPSKEFIEVLQENGLALAEFARSERPQLKHRSLSCTFSTLRQGKLLVALAYI